MPLLDYLDNFIQQIQGARQYAESLDWTYQEPPDEPPGLHANRIEWRRSQSQSDNPAISIDEQRQDVERVMKAYIHESPTGEILLAKVKAGGGKTHAGVTVAQWAAEQGMKVLWASDRHVMFQDLVKMSHFDSKLWYHFLPMHESTGDSDPIPTTCRFAEAQNTWARKGYRSLALCTQVCTFDKHINHCLYRKQSKRKEPIVFAMHNHLSSGLSISDFDLVIVDELPMNAFIEERIIPPDEIRLPGGIGPVDDLLSIMAMLAKVGVRSPYSGKMLFDVIGPLLGDVYAQVEAFPDTLQQIPVVASPDNINAVPFWYLSDFMQIASLEYEAWRNNWPQWVERIRIDRRGLHLYKRAPVWEKLPFRMIALDATSHTGLYKQIFGRPIREYQPMIQRQGNVYQVTGRLYGASFMYDKEKAEVTKYAQEMLTIAKSIAARYTGRVGVICHKAVRPIFEAEFGEENVQHFHNLRGTNAMEDVECLLVIGNPAPNLSSVINATAALNPDRIKPFGKLNEQGYPAPIFYDAEREYRITPELYKAHGGQTPWRKVKGFWNEPELQAVYESAREDELVQAIHRARPNVSPGDVWVFTSTPTGEPLDGIWDDPPIGPDAIFWKSWLNIEPWLEAQRAEGQTINAQSLADAAGASVVWVRRNQWIDAIAEYMPELWEKVLIPTGSRPSKGIHPTPLLEQRAL